MRLCTGKCEGDLQAQEDDRIALLLMVIEEIARLPVQEPPFETAPVSQKLRNWYLHISSRSLVGRGQRGWQGKAKITKASFKLLGWHTKRSCH